MTASESYGAFAYAYDQALGQRYFRAVRRLLAEVLERYPATVTTHLDVACGTGLAMPFFASRGFDSTGVDLSLVMLQLARARARASSPATRARCRCAERFPASPASTTRSTTCWSHGISPSRSARSRGSWTAIRCSSST